jgi:ABC-type Na+ efflux pump permease subunit
MGTTVKTLEAAGEATSALQDQLKQQVSSNIEAGGNQSASAILAAGNAQLSGLERPMQVALTSANSKERYAAATVLSRDSGQQQLLIEHIATEPSDLITNAILANWDRDRLTGDQRLQLQQIADNSTGQKAQMIERFLNP